MGERKKREREMKFEISLRRTEQRECKSGGQIPGALTENYTTLFPGTDPQTTVMVYYVISLVANTVDTWQPRILTKWASTGLPVQPS